MILDFSTIVLISVNFVEMVSILFMLLPIVDIVILSKNIAILKEAVHTNTIVLTSMVFSGSVMVTYGIIKPLKTLQDLRALKLTKSLETAEEKLLRILTATDASRNYILGVFSLFFLLVILRLFDYVTFSAKLTEFSNLMANYDLVDITYTQSELEPVELEEATYILNDFFDEDRTVHWPSIVDLNKKEHSKIEKFFKVTPKKPKATDKDKASIPEEEQTSGKENSTKKDSSTSKDKDK